MTFVENVGHYKVQKYHLFTGMELYDTSVL